VNRLGRLNRNALVLLVGTILALPLPLLLSGTQQQVAVRIMLFALLGSAWNVMGGFAGQFSFGHAAYFGLGAYSSAYLLVNRGISPWVGMLVGAALAAAFGALTGFLAFRYELKGAYFALATFAFAEMLRLITLNLDLVNRAVGFRVPLIEGSSWALLQFPPSSPNYYYAMLALLVAGLAIVIALMRSKMGYYIVALRDDEPAARAVGIDGMRYKVAAVAISAALTAVGGAYYVQFIFFIDPELAFGPGVSVQILLPAIIGGVGTIWGPVVGAAVLVPLSELTAGLIRNPPAFLSFLGGRAGLDLVIYGIVLIVMIVQVPRGVYGAAAAWVRGRSGQVAP
jgi:branched-chain amino acid transport system permease protein